MEDVLAESYSYRGVTLPVYKSDAGYYTIVDGKLVKLETNYRSYIEQILDRQLDQISEIDSESWIEWFDNAGHTDIRLRCKGRVLKIWLVADPYKVDLVKITAEATNIMYKLPKKYLK